MADTNTPLEDLKMSELLAQAKALGIPIPAVGAKKVDVIEKIRAAQAVQSDGQGAPPPQALDPHEAAKIIAGTAGAGAEAVPQIQVSGGAAGPSSGLSVQQGGAPPAPADTTPAQAPEIPPRAATQCPYCDGTGKHPDGEPCPYCRGTGTEDVDEPAESGPPPVVGVLAGRSLVGMNLFELRGVAAVFGIPGASAMGVGEIYRELQGNRADDIQKAINVAVPEQPLGTWTAVRALDGSVIATDPEGWWTATVRRDGSATITKLGEPNLHNRIVAASAGDVTWEVDDLVTLLERLDDLYTVVDAMIPRNERVESE